MRRHQVKLRWVWRYCPGDSMWRLFRVVWQRGTVGDGQGYAAKLTFAWSWKVWRHVFGLRVRYHRAYGGIYP